MFLFFLFCNPHLHCLNVPNEALIPIYISCLAGIDLVYSQLATRFISLMQ